MKIFHSFFQTYDSINRDRWLYALDDLVANVRIVLFIKKEKVNFDMQSKNQFIQFLIKTKKQHYIAEVYTYCLSILW